MTRALKAIESVAASRLVGVAIVTGTVLFLGGLAWI